VKIVGALLAAGASQRMGQSKQLLKLDGDVCLVRRSAQEMLASALERLSIVVDPEAPAIAEAVRGLPHELVASRTPTEGIAASIRAAVAWATKLEARALLLSVCDQPKLSRSHLDRLIATFEAEGGLVASFYAGSAGVPAIFPAPYFGELSQLQGDVGAAKILRKAPALSWVAWPEGAQDLDHPADVAAWRAREAAQ
jgi:molybdenum cofactor cytidylyltransferase